MGYRNYIAKMSRKEYNKIKSMTSSELVEYQKIEVDEDGSWYKGVYEFGKELYNFGKYTEFSPPKGSQLPFFKKKEMKERYEEYEFFVVTAEFLEYIINSYKEMITTYYNNMIDPFLGKRETIMNRDEPSRFLNSIKTEYNYPNNKHTFDFTKITDEEQTALFKIIEHVRDMRTEWTHLTPYDLTRGDEVTTSWKYEYGIFELVRIYKSFDWKKDIMFYYGY